MEPPKLNFMALSSLYVHVEKLQIYTQISIFNLFFTRYGKLAHIWAIFLGLGNFGASWVNLTEILYNCWDFVCCCGSFPMVPEIILCHSG